MSKSKQYKSLMKFLLGVLTIVIAFAILFLASCNQQHHTTSLTIIGSDRTQQMLAQPDSTSIIPLLGLDSDQNNGATVEFFDVTDVSLNKYSSFSISVDNGGILSNSFTRKREVQRFMQDIATFLDTASHDTVGRERSSIYIPMVHALEELAKSSANNRTLILYSDLFENDNDFSFYSQGTLSSLRSSPTGIIDVLLTKASVPDLTGIHIYFVYQPQNAKDDETFRLISGFYKTWLESRGATVHIVANVMQ